MNYRYEDMPMVQPASLAGDIILAPMNNLSAAVYHALKRKGIVVRAICDNNSQLSGQSYDDCTVMAPQAAAEQYPNAAVIICTDLYWQEIGAQMDSLGLREQYMFGQVITREDYMAIDSVVNSSSQNGIAGRPFNLASRQYYFAPRSEKPSLQVMSRLTFLITERCSLKCRQCISCMQYFQDPQHADIETMFKTIDRLDDLVDFVPHVCVSGGEAFLHPELPRLLRKLRSKKYCGYIEVLTNGTLLPRADVMAALKETDSVVHISDYGPLSKNKDRLIALMSENGIGVESHRHPHWFKAMEFVPAGSYEDARARYEVCDRPCTCVIGEELWVCSVLCRAKRLQAVPAHAEDWLSLAADSAVTVSDVHAYINREEPFPGCFYCSGHDYSTPMPVAEQTPTPVAYTKYT